MERIVFNPKYIEFLKKFSVEFEQFLKEAGLYLVDEDELKEEQKELTIEQKIKVKNRYFVMLVSLLSEKYGVKRSYEILSEVIKDVKKEKNND